MKFKDPCKDVRITREKLGKNQSDFWRALGMTQSAGSRYETGRTMPKTVQMLMRIAHGTNGDKVVRELRG